uniref:SAM-dependent methyltransferase n=1 Tax=Streptomyces sp. NBC_00049 TaxID=2903617 RepID=A0AAU2JHM4_9ACTN
MNDAEKPLTVDQLRADFANRFTTWTLDRVENPESEDWVVILRKLS